MSDHTSLPTPPAPSGTSRPLKVLIAGAGIGGLTAALGLRQQGHEVTLFEQSRLANEYGAAITIAVNASAVLRRLGVYLEHHGAVPGNGVREFAGDQPVRFVDLRDDHARWPHPYHFILRTDLHRALKEAATGSQGEGKPAVLNTSSRVREVDIDAARVTLEDGSVFIGDLVVGADGGKSTARYAIPGNDKCHPFPYAYGLFRTLIPAQKLADDPRTADLVEKRDCFNIFRKGERAIVMYPGNSGNTMNLAITQPKDWAKVDGKGGWDQAGSKERMEALYGDFGPAVSALLSHADASTVGMWQLMDMDELPTWAAGRLALLGDAAHPFLPYLGQGGAQAIEDAAVLSALLPRADTAPEDVPGRLALYEKLRHDRATYIQVASRLRGLEQEGMIKRNRSDFTKMTNYLYQYDAWEVAEKALKGEPIPEGPERPLLDLPKAAEQEA